MARQFTRLSVDGVKNAQRLKYGLDKLMSDAESRLTDIEDVLAQVVAAQAAADAAAADAATAQTTANTANSTANTVKRDDAISTSWTSPGTILTGRDAGANASIIIANHTRYYSDTNSVSVTGTTLTGKSYSTVYYVYYDQTSRAGGAVSYQATTNANTALPGKAAGRHYCGKVTTPAAAAADTTGDVNPPGGGGGIGGGEVP